MSVIVKAKYSCVHSDNYQGGMGKVVIDNEYLEYDEFTTLNEVLDAVKAVISGLTKKENFPIENPRLISMELIETRQ